MNKLLVLGGTGMLGGPVAHRLRADGFKVRLLARDPKKARTMFGDSFEIVAGDVTDVCSLERYCRAFHPEVESVSVMPVDAARAVAKSTGNQTLSFFAKLMAYFDQASEVGDPAKASRLLGSPATTLDAWIEQRKARRK